MRIVLRFALPILVLIAAIAAAWTLAVSRPSVAQVPVAPPALLVEVGTAERVPVTYTVRSQGTVTPRTSTTLISEVSGNIVDVAPAFVSGGFFRKGDVLVRIDPRNYRTNVKRASAAVARAKTQVATENALAGYAFQDWQRLRSLDAATGPASDLTLRKPQLAEAIAGLESAEADMEKAVEDLRRTIIRAPYDGMVRSKRADVGQFVNTGTALADTFATDYAEVRLPLNQNDLQYLDLPEWNTSDIELPATLSAEFGGTMHEWQAMVVRSEGVFDESRRVLHVVAQVPDPYDMEDKAREPLRIGAFVSAEIAGRSGGDLVVIPRHALRRGETLWVVGEDLTIHPRQVEIARSDEDFAYISQGVEHGERYCLTPPDQPLPGMKVRLSG